jgi:hypothetical protein
MLWVAGFGVGKRAPNIVAHDVRAREFEAVREPTWLTFAVTLDVSLFSEGPLVRAELERTE